MRRIRLLVVGAVMALSTLGSATPSQAMTCADGLETACSAAGTVICTVLAKGQPCLM